MRKFCYLQPSNLNLLELQKFYDSVEEPLNGVQAIQKSIKTFENCVRVERPLCLEII